MKSIAILAVLVSVTLLSRIGHAGTNPNVSWSSAGSGCVIDQASASIAAVSATTGDIAFAAGQTGTIRITCPVHGLFATDVGGSTTDMKITFYDQDGTTDSCVVKAFLVRNNASATEGGATIASYDDTTNSAPDAPATSSPFRNHKDKSFSHTFNFDNNYYWIDVELTRSVTTCQSALEGVQLVNSIL